MKEKTYKTFALAFLISASIMTFCLANAMADEISQYTLTVNLEGADCSVTVDPSQDAYNASDLVQLTPVAAPGWNFTGWSGDLSGNDNPVTITMDTNKNITATFTQIFTLTINTVGQGTVSPGNQTYASGTVVNLEAVSETDWVFSDWSGDVTGTSNMTITMDGNKTVTATFTEYVAPTPTPSPTTTPTPTPSTTPSETPATTPTPTPTPTPSPNPTSSGTPDQSSNSTPTEAGLTEIIAAVAAAIIISAVACGLFLQRKKQAKVKVTVQ